MNEQEPYGECDEVIVCMVLAFCIGSAIITLAYRLTATMSDTPPELRPLSFNPSEPAIHHRVTGAIEIWTGENEAEYRMPERCRTARWHGGASFLTAGAMCSAVERARSAAD